MARKKKKESNINSRICGCITKAQRLNDYPSDEPNFYVCFKCGKKINKTQMPSNHSELYAGTNYKMPYCRDCLDEMHQHYFNYYTEKNEADPQKSSVKRMCMLLDIYYCDQAYNSSLNSNKRSSIMSAYIRQTNLQQYNGRTYDTTIYEENENRYKDLNLKYDSNFSTSTENDLKKYKRSIELFGKGFNPEQYEFLQNNYDDWTARHECKTKAQEELFKRICFKQLSIHQYEREGNDTKDLDKSLLDLMNSGNLTPKQNTADTLADTQTFGTLIEKWENTDPIPEPDDEFKDVDRISVYLHTFFYGHLAKMIGVKNFFSETFNKFMGKYTVKKPELEDDSSENSQAIYDKIFGNVNLEDE